MPGEIFNFEWFINSAGYSLLPLDNANAAAHFHSRRPQQPVAESAADWAISANLPTRQHVFRDRRYFPLAQHTSLFLSFAETASDPKSILAFASRYGLLGLEAGSPVSGTIELSRPAELVSAWNEEISSMRRALDVWKLVLAEDREGLAAVLDPYMKWAAADRAFASDAQSSAPASEDLPQQLDCHWLRWFRMNPRCLEWYEAGDFDMAARSRLQAVINERLEGRVSPRVLWTDSARSRWSLYFVPNSLVGALWLQFAQAITSRKDYRRCRQCHTWFEIDHYTARTNRFFCSNACRSKAYRERQQQARRLAASGLGIAAIAAQLGSDEKAVKRWVEASEGS